MILKVKHIKDYVLKVFFDDGTIKIIDLYPFLKKSTHPLISKFLDKKLFKTFYLDNGVLCWGDNEFDLNPVSIYNGDFDLND